MAENVKVIVVFKLGSLTDTVTGNACLHPWFALPFALFCFL
jgi:hypothetical protein